MRMPFSAGFLALTLSIAAQAAGTTIAAVNMPAWVEHEGRTSPLIAGQGLASSDVIRTGAGARVLIKLPEGSQIKLGENAVFRMDNLNEADGTHSQFTAVVNVLKGAFRFTTGLLAKHRDRDVLIHVSTVTAGIRGTDVWGKSDDERDLICLLEGKIAVSHEGEQGSKDMSDPLSFFVAPKGQAALPISSVDADKVKNDWAPQTEPQSGQGLAEAKGRWKLTVASADQQDEALKWLDTLNNAGYAAHIRPDGAGKFHVRVEGLASKADAVALGARLKTEVNAPEASVGH
jgi:hypothetical protein